MAQGPGHRTHPPGLEPTCGRGREAHTLAWGLRSDTHGALPCADNPGDCKHGPLGHGASACGFSSVQRDMEGEGSVGWPIPAAAAVSALCLGERPARSPMLLGLSGTLLTPPSPSLLLHPPL